MWRAHYYLGRIYREQDKPKEAATEFISRDQVEPARAGTVRRARRALPQVGLHRRGDQGRVTGRGERPRRRTRSRTSGTCSAWATTTRATTTRRSKRSTRRSRAKQRQPQGEVPARSGLLPQGRLSTQRQARPRGVLEVGRRVARVRQAAGAEDADGHRGEERDARASRPSRSRRPRTWSRTRRPRSAATRATKSARQDDGLDEVGPYRSRRRFVDGSAARCLLRQSARARVATHGSRDRRDLSSAFLRRRSRRRVYGLARRRDARPIGGDLSDATCASRRSTPVGHHPKPELFSACRGPKRSRSRDKKLTRMRGVVSFVNAGG